jgi:hypothetical protein
MLLSAVSSTHMLKSAKQEKSNAATKTINQPIKHALIPFKAPHYVRNPQQQLTIPSQPIHLRTISMVHLPIRRFIHLSLAIHISPCLRIVLRAHVHIRLWLDNIVLIRHIRRRGCIRGLWELHVHMRLRVRSARVHRCPRVHWLHRLHHRLLHWLLHRLLHRRVLLRRSTKRSRHNRSFRPLIAATAAKDEGDNAGEDTDTDEGSDDNSYLCAGWPLAEGFAAAAATATAIGVTGGVGATSISGSCVGGRAVC